MVACSFIHTSYIPLLDFSSFLPFVHQNNNYHIHHDRYAFVSSSSQAQKGCSFWRNISAPDPLAHSIAPLLLYSLVTGAGYNSVFEKGLFNGQVILITGGGTGKLPFFTLSMRYLQPSCISSPSTLVQRSHPTFCPLLTPTVSF